MVDRPHFNTNSNSAFRPEPVDINTAILTVKELNTTASISSDGKALLFLWDALCVIIPFLTCIVNILVVTDVFSEAWKHALVVPLYKHGDPDCVINYTPLSKLPIVSKILEKIVAKQLSYYSENKLLSNSQHGFRPKLSTETALTTITVKLYDNIDNKIISMLTLCDLSKSFDTVNHKALLEKYSLLSIDELWFNDYLLNNRTMSIRIDNHISNKKKNIGYGVPRGSTFGYILFVIYANDLSVHVKGFLVKYADDTHFIHSGTMHNLFSINKGR